jgi:surfactin synthase thioesterase subunit
VTTTAGAPAGSGDRTSATATRWLPGSDLDGHDREGGGRATVFCLPYSGCGASIYHRWPRRLGDLALRPIQLPGRENRLREPCPPSYEELAAAMVTALEPFLDRPFAFFGHCGAALLAFEATLACLARDRPPAALFVSSQVAPHDGPFGRYLGLDDEALRRELRTIGPELGQTVDDELLDLVISGMQRDLDLNRGYRREPGPRLPCPIRAIGWQGDDEIGPDLMSGWAAWGPTAFDVLPGGHRRFLEAPSDLLGVLTSTLVGP